MRGEAKEGCPQMTQKKARLWLPTSISRPKSISVHQSASICVIRGQKIGLARSAVSAPTGLVHGMNAVAGSGASYAALPAVRE
jgi:hypothetical protein